MDIRQFKEQLGKVYAFTEECRKEAVEILKRNGGVVEMNLGRMFFIGRGGYTITKSWLDEDNNIRVTIESDGEHDQEVVGFDEATWDRVMLSDFMYSLYKADGQDEDETSEFDFVDDEHGIGFDDGKNKVYTSDGYEPSDCVLVFKKDSNGKFKYEGHIDEGISVSDIEDMDETEFENFLVEYDLI